MGADELQLLATGQQRPERHQGGGGEGGQTEHAAQAGASVEDRLRPEPQEHQWRAHAHRGHRGVHEGSEATALGDQVELGRKEV